MSLSYASVNLIVPTQELCAWIEHNISPADVCEFVYKDWPGEHITGIAFPEWDRVRPIKIGCLYWPGGAQRWAVGHFLCSEEQLADIRARVYPGDGEPDPATFTIDSNLANFFTTSLYLLPPRPLSQIAGLNGHYLLTLVDERYYWWSQSTGLLTVTEGTTTWQNLYDSIAALLGITITADTIDADYLKPSSDMTARYESLPLILDAVAYNVGQRIVRELDGDVLALNYATSRTRLDANVLAAKPVQAGGIFNFA